MAQQCPLCQKSSRMGGKRNLLRGKYNPTKKVRKYPNLQWAHFPDGHREKICTDCLKKGKHLTAEQGMQRKRSIKKARA